ncbi:MAG: 2Fe-2S iron-sulfur cluster-binding protein [Candidatus Tectomicrobia bacterium]|nr:2Fe-2S iron-sulfur cluster-binding protein [Candidatus Tectomicrobia bacterium]
MRLDNPYGVYLDRDKAISFQFDGRTYMGYEGDTIASALAASSVKLISRSFKYHRPRGILSMAGQDGNSLVQVGDEPGVRADARAIEEGMVVTAQNVVGNLENDYGRFIESLGRFLPVGFYYKAFYRPKGAWRFWEPIIRRIAGLGRVDLRSRSDYTDKQYRFSDVAVIGGGPAGMSAALEAAENGAEVLLVDENPMLGGSLNYARFSENRDDIETMSRNLVRDVERHPGIEGLTNARCTGWFDDNWLSIATKRRLLKLRSQCVVVASGSFEQPAVFRNNDLPGVMLGSAAQRLLRLYAVKPGQRAVVVTGNNDGYGVALDLLDAGVDVVAVIEMRKHLPAGELIRAVVGRGVEISCNHAIYSAMPGSGKRSIKGVTVAAIVGDGQLSGAKRNIACDLLCMSVGYSPAAQLLCHSGGRLIYDEHSSVLKVSGLPRQGNGESAIVAGSLNGAFDLNAVMADGKHAGWAAADVAGLNRKTEPALPDLQAAPDQNHPWPIISHPDGKEFVDYDEDLQIKDIEQTVAEGYDDLELVKRYSTVVMGPSQGRQSALNNLRIATTAAGRSLRGVSITTQRPPFHPEPIQLLAGRSFQPVRRTAIHHRHLELGAQMMPAGDWLRPGYYGDPAQRTRLIEQEALAIRNRVGLIDVSTLGKLEVRGPDAAEFMNRMYTFAYLRQPVGRLRYVLMTDETGVISDDGIAARFSDDHFYVSTTTGGSTTVYRTMLQWNARWCLDVDITNVTSAYAAISIAGPLSRKVLQEIPHDVDLSADAFPYLEARCGKLSDVEVRLLRVGFVGELGWEIHVPSSQAEFLWDILLDAGREFACKPVGVEAQRLLRLEKGHIIVGQDTDGLTVPEEAAMSWAIAKKKPFHIGKRSCEILASRKQTRCLVGFMLPADSKMPEESNLTLSGSDIAGRVTSIAFSPALRKAIGLAYVRPEQSGVGSHFEVKLSDGKRVSAEVVELPFYDRENTRQAL